VLGFATRRGVFLQGALRRREFIGPVGGAAATSSTGAFAPQPERIQRIDVTDALPAPGASFVVNGAAQARDAALTTASAEVKWMNGWSAAATFEGEFSDVTSSYAGKGVVRYAWQATAIGISRQSKGCEQAWRGACRRDRSARRRRRREMIKKTAPAV
jgi:hypothetical protein